MKKYKKQIILSIIIAIIAGMIITHRDLFGFIDLIIVTPITNILFLIYNLIGDFGSAIIIFTLLVKFAMYPLTKSQLHQTRLMKKMQPELAEIRKNCNGNKQLESLQTMDLYKKYNVKPLGSIFTLFIQLPIFIAIYTAIRVIATPMVNDNLANRAYDFVKYEGSEVSQVIDLQNTYFNPEEGTEAVYDFHPYLFDVIPLDGVANQVFRGDFSLANIFAILCALLAAVVQYIVTKQQQPSGGSKSAIKSLKESAKAGKEPSQEDISALTSSQMAITMPLMLLIIMINLQGALVFYYFLSNIISVGMNKFILYRAERTMDDMTDRTITRELKHIKEAEIIENKKTGTKITISKNNKKRR